MLRTLPCPHGQSGTKIYKRDLRYQLGGAFGPNVDAFEKDLETFLGNQAHVAALTAGTAALHLLKPFISLEMSEILRILAKTLKYKTALFLQIRNPTPNL